MAERSRHEYGASTVRAVYFYLGPYEGVVLYSHPAAEQMQIIGNLLGLKKKVEEINEQLILSSRRLKGTNRPKKLTSS